MVQALKGVRLDVIRDKRRFARALGRALREAREARGMTQEELGRRVLESLREIDRPAVEAALGQLVRHLRLSQGLTQHALAKRARMSRSALGDIEHARRAFKLFSMVQLADALGVSYEVFLAKIEQFIAAPSGRPS